MNVRSHSLPGPEKTLIYDTVLSRSYIKQKNCPTIWKNCRFPDFQQFCKFNHKPGIGLGENVIYSTILKQVLQEKKTGRETVYDYITL